MSMTEVRTLVAAFARAVGSVLLIAVSLASVASEAQTVSDAAGEVEFSKGVGFAQQPGQLPRTLGKGQTLYEGDRLTMADGSTAIIKLTDGTRMTLRPNSEMVMNQYQYQAGSPKNNMVVQLLRGGFRAITGLIPKSNPDAAKIQTTTATVGIRGTDFDARVCGPECKNESDQVKDTARPNAILASAKLVSAEGDIHATDISQTKRILVEGGSVYPGDVIDLGTHAKAVLVFRDESRITLGANTHFKVESFVYDEKTPKEGNFVVSLVRGSLRALTGLVGKANHRNVKFTTPTATIGIRGTGLDLDCSALETESAKVPTKDDLALAASSFTASCNVHTWLGTIEVSPIGQTMMHVLQAGQGLDVSRTAVRPTTVPTLEKMQRPDTVPVKMQQLFGSGGAGVSADEQGLFVFVREGHVEIKSSKETLQLGRGETGFAGNNGSVGRPVNMPLFIQNDKTPMPNATNLTLRSVVRDGGKSTKNQCSK